MTACRNWRYNQKVQLAKSSQIFEQSNLCVHPLQKYVQHSTHTTQMDESYLMSWGEYFLISPVQSGSGNRATRAAHMSDPLAAFSCFHRSNSGLPPIRPHLDHLQTRKGSKNEFMFSARFLSTSQCQGIMPTEQVSQKPSGSHVYT